MVKETWFDRDLPVLKAIVELDEEESTYWATDDAVVEKTGLDLAAVRQSMKALGYNDPPFGEFGTGSMAGDWEAKNITGHARQVVGQWPAPKTESADQIAALLGAFETAEEDAPDEATKSKIRQAADTFKGLPANVLGAVSTAVFLKLTGLS